MDHTAPGGSVTPLTTQSQTWHAGRRRPLIEQCTNEWQNSPQYNEATSFESDSDWFDVVTTTAERMWALTKAPKFQRLALLFVFATIAAILCWRNFLSVFVAENVAAWDSINAKGKANQGHVFGQNKRVHFPGMVHLNTLDSKHLPRTSKANPRNASKHQRLIFIGDIHGCMDELQELLAKVAYKQDQDHIIALGDMINKGPKSREVVEFLMKHGASGVRGNHEDRILLVAKQLASTSLTAQEDGQREVDPMKETKAARKSREEREVARSLSQQQLDWLNACPVILRIGDVGHLGEVVAVHGGLIPGLRLENQDPVSVMNMRIIDLSTHMPSHKHSLEGSIPWAEFWNKFQRLIPAQRTSFGFRTAKSAFKHTTVVYGHDSKRGLQVDTYTKGLDSGCVNGNKLTAWVVGDMAKEEIVQVNCKEHRS